MLNMDKIREALQRTDAKIEALDPVKYEELYLSMQTLTPLEIMKYQETKSIAQIEQKIDLEVALWIYNTVGHWETSPLADRIIITQLIAHWLGAI